MRRYVYALLVTAAALFVCVGAGAQKKSKPEAATLKADASLAETLAWLNDNLTRYGEFTYSNAAGFDDSGVRSRTRFLGLEAQGCSVTYRVKRDYIGAGGGGGLRPPTADLERRVINVGGGLFGRPRSPDPNDNVYRPKVWQPFAPAASDPNVEEGTVNLAALDPSLVRGETPTRRGGVVIFEAGKGDTPVSYRGWDGKLKQYNGGELWVGKREHVKPIADALRHAVALCKK